MQFPIATGQAAELLGRTEPQLAELVRRGRILPAPTVFAGRRMWQPQHIRQAAALLGIDAARIEAILDPADAEAVAAPEAPQ